MARPLKSGLDYFPLDVAFDDPVELIEAEFGLEGLAILIKIWQKIYANGYYLDWNDDAALLFAKKINVNKDRIDTIIAACFARNVISKCIFDKYGILTSRGIQKRYITACVSAKRKSIIMDERYLLVEEKFRKLITELIPLIKEETPINSGIITEETPINSGESTQRKGKETERKGKESIKDYSREIENFRQRYSDFLDLVDKYFEILRTTRRSGKISDSVIYQVYTEMNKRPVIVVKYACLTVINKPDLHSKKENYFYGIMRNTDADEATRKLSVNSKDKPKKEFITS
jgi:hypothetical protein